MAANSGRMGTLVTDLTLNSASFETSIKKATATLNSNVAQMKRSFASVQKAADMVKGLTVAAIGSEVAQKAKAVLDLADGYGILQGRIQNATKETGDYAVVSQQLEKIAIDTGSALESNVDLFQRMGMSAKTLGASNQDLLSLVQILSQLGAISGASTTAMNSGILQFGQAMSGAKLQMQEVAPLMDTMPALITAIAKGMGLTNGQFIAMVKNGKVLSKDVLRVLLQQSGSIQKEFNAMPNSMQRGWNALTVSFTSLVGQLDKAFDVTKTVGGGFTWLGKQFDWLSGVIRKNSTNIKLWRNEIDRSIALQATMGGGSFGMPSPRPDMRDSIEKEFDKRKRAIEAAAQQASKPPPALPPPKPPPSSGGGSTVRLAKIPSIALPKGKSAAQQEMERLQGQAKELTLSVQDIWTKESVEIAKADQLLKKHLITQSTYEKVVNNTKRSTLDNFRVEGVKEAVNGLVEPYKQALDAFKPNLSDALDDTQFQAVQQVIQDTLTPLEKYNQQVEYLTYLHQQGGLATDTFNRALASAKDELNKTHESAQKFSQAISKTISQFGDQFFESIVKGAKNGKFAFKDFVSSAMLDLAKLIFKLTVAIPIANSLSNALNKPNSAAGAAKGIASSAGGSILGTIGKGIFGGIKNILGFADGGSPPVGKVSLVGEEGPELFVPRTNGLIIPNNALGGTQQTIQVNQTINLSAGVAQAVQEEVNKMRPQLRRDAVDAVSTAINKGGSLSRQVGARR